MDSDCDGVAVPLGVEEAEEEGVSDCVCVCDPVWVGDAVSVCPELTVCVAELLSLCD